MSTDSEWKKWGKNNPYYGVLSSEKYRKKNLDEYVIDDFFRTGELHIDYIFKKFKEMNVNNQPKVSLDFGCGAGRLILPLSKISEKVIGIDISEGMLNEAERNLNRKGIKNVDLLLSKKDVFDSIVSVDFVHTYIVLQHINPSRGNKIIENLIRKINPSGIGYIHLTYHNESSKLKKAFLKILYKFPVLNPVKNIFLGKKWTEPIMRMYQYDLNKIFRIFHENGIHKVVSELINDSGHLGIQFFFQKGV